MPVTVDIVLPCYNPNATWYQELLDFKEFIQDRYKIHYIVVNDGSSNPTVQDQITILKNNTVSVSYISYAKNKGKGYALREGVKVSEADYIVYTDIDFPFTNNSTAAVIEVLVKSSADVVAGYRDQLYYQKKMSGFRKILSKAFRFFMRAVLKMKVSDTQCGLKGFNKSGKKKFLETKINRYLFDFEFIFLSGKDTAIQIEAVPVQLKDNVIFSKMKLKILIQESFNLLSVLLFRKL
ncbi:glycosyl transferase [Sphingobacteriaceae bacterium]|nr:glycosyl transferase [Sphingobacteriaceae bacterium]